jgi:hypothetical protein
MALVGGMVDCAMALPLTRACFDAVFLNLAEANATEIKST